MITRITAAAVVVAADPMPEVQEIEPGRNVTLSSSKGPGDLAAAILFREILKPLAQGLGPVGEIVLGAVADDLFVRKPGKPR